MFAKITYLTPQCVEVLLQCCVSATLTLALEVVRGQELVLAQCSAVHQIYELQYLNRT